MRYIYYVVAALIFLAVVNLAASFIGNDTQELLTELNPDQQATEAGDQAALESATPPVVGLEAGETTIVEQVAEVTSEPAQTGNAAEVTGTNESDVATVPAEQSQADTSNSIEQAVQSVQSEVVTAADNAGSDVAAAVTEVETAGTEVATITDKADAAVETVQETLAETAPTAEAAAETVVQNTTAIPAEVATPQAQETTSQATTAVAAAVATTVATKLAANTESPETIQTVEPASQTEVATPPPATAGTATAAEVEKVAETSKPSLIKSLGDSAGSAATAVVGGAQQAVETVVEAARSLIDTDDSKDPTDKASEVAATPGATDTAQPSAADAAISTASTPTPTEITTTSEQVVAATQASKTIADAENKPAPEAAAAEVAQNPPQSDAEPSVAPAIAPTATAVTKPAAPEVGASATARYLTTAPSEVLDLVKRHPGKVLMIGFFSPNCRDCKPSLTWLNEMRRKYWAQGLQVIGVNLGTEAQAKNYLQDAPVSFEILHDPERKLASAFWLAKQPSTYLVNGSGILLSTHQGHSPSRIGEYEDAIRLALEQR